MTILDSYVMGLWAREVKKRVSILGGPFVVWDLDKSLSHQPQLKPQYQHQYQPRSRPCFLFAKKTWKEGLNHSFDGCVYSELMRYLNDQVQEKSPEAISVLKLTKNGFQSPENETGQKQTGEQSTSVQDGLQSTEEKVLEQKRDKTPSIPKGIQTEKSDSPEKEVEKFPQNQKKTPRAQQCTPIQQQLIQESLFDETESFEEKLRRLDNMIKDCNPFDATKMITAQYMAGSIKNGYGDLRVDRYLGLGYLLVNTGRPTEAPKIFDALLSVFPTVMAGYLGRGTAYAMQSKYVEALKDFTIVIQLSPKCVDAYKRRGQVCIALGLLEQAKDDYITAGSIQPDADIYNQRGLVYYQLKNYKRALEDFNHLLTYKEGQVANTHNSIGLCYYNMGQCDKAIEAYKKAVSMEENYKQAHAHIGQAYKDWGKFELSMAAYERALKLDPTYGDAYYLRGLTLFHVGKHFEASKEEVLSFSRDYLLPSLSTSNRAYHFPPIIHL
eukprot:TRINITY_DN13602_c0_g2_i1.p1 TRINITY_DN13602_c0_g2~~TRINITY_DN13602_c0_g2_i1.p1  ORF type:complete len:496 (-),score=84.46 TRINITY_DN13602_c0_g2_i1:324-1811(-)